MIIKSMSRKDNSFSKLYDYITKGMEGKYQHPNAFVHNFYTQFENRAEILKAFSENVSKLKTRKNGNSFYHEVISVKVNPQITRTRHYEALYNITSDYIKMRADKCLVIGGIHDEHDHHIHMHLMISSNELGKSKRYYLTTKEFDTVKKLCEEKALALHPELAQEVLINAKKKKGNTSNKEQELKRRTKKPTIKEQFKEKLKTIFDKSVDKADFFNHLENEKIEIYVRGKTIGFKDLEHNRKHRLKTLGLEAEFEKINNTLSKHEKKAPTDKPHTKAKTQNQKSAVKSKKESTSKVKNTAKNKEKSKSTDKVKYRIFTGFKQEFFKEWIQGDFSEREQRIRDEKFKKYRKPRKKIIPKDEMTTYEVFKEKANQWVKGDFSALEARICMKNWKTKHDKEQVEIDSTKSREEQTTFENIKETAKEWVFGDFTNRENRAKKQKQKEDKEKWLKDYKKQQSEKSKQSEQSKVKTKPKTAETQKRRESISKVRKQTNASKNKSKDNTLGKSL